MSDKIPHEVEESREQPYRAERSDKDAAVTGHIIESNTKMTHHAGEPMKHKGNKMPHEYFHDAMTGALCK